MLSHRTLRGAYRGGKILKRRNLTTPIVYLIMLGIIVLLVSGFDLSGDKVKKISYSEFIDDVRNGRIQAAEVTELKLVGCAPTAR